MVSRRRRRRGIRSLVRPAAAAADNLRRSPLTLPAPWASGFHSALALSSLLPGPTSVCVCTGPVPASRGAPALGTWRENSPVRRPLVHPRVAGGHFRSATAERHLRVRIRVPVV